MEMKKGGTTVLTPFTPCMRIMHNAFHPHSSRRHLTLTFLRNVYVLTYDAEFFYIFFLQRIEYR